MRECKICLCEITENFHKHEKSQQHKNFLKQANIDKYIQRDINADTLKDILYEGIKEHIKIFLCIHDNFLLEGK